MDDKFYRKRSNRKNSRLLQGSKECMTEIQKRKFSRESLWRFSENMLSMKIAVAEAVKENRKLNVNV